MAWKDMWDFNHLCTECLGADSDGDVIEKRTAFGHYVAGAGIFLPVSQKPEHRAQVAKFLRDWADRLEEQP